MKSDDLAARAVRARRIDAPDTEDRGHILSPRVVPVRVTADLAPLSYRQLVGFASDLANELGVARVPHVEVIRVLVDLLVSDARIAAAVRDEVAARLRR